MDFFLGYVLQKPWYNIDNRQNKKNTHSSTRKNNFGAQKYFFQLCFLPGLCRYDVIFDVNNCQSVVNLNMSSEYWILFYSVILYLEKVFKYRFLVAS